MIKKRGIVITDSSPVFSLAVADCLWVLEDLFDSASIPEAVWEEITKDKTSAYYFRIFSFFKDKKHKISGFNDLSFIMDYGESESIILYKELNADFLIIDDKKARKIAQNIGVNCIGTIGVLSIAKERGLIKELNPIFKNLLNNKRFYSIELLNAILEKNKEAKINLIVNNE